MKEYEKIERAYGYEALMEFYAKKIITIGSVTDTRENIMKKFIHTYEKVLLESLSYKYFREQSNLDLPKKYAEIMVIDPENIWVFCKKDSYLFTKIRMKPI